MNDNDEIQKQIENYIIWCRGERDRLTFELDQYQSATLNIGTRTTGEPVTQDTLDHISYLRLTIEQLSCVIATRVPPTDRTPTSVVEAEIISLAGWASHQVKCADFH